MLCAARETDKDMVFSKDFVSVWTVDENRERQGSNNLSPKVSHTHTALENVFKPYRQFSQTI